MKTHNFVALVIYLVVVLLCSIFWGRAYAVDASQYLAVFLVILFGSRIIAGIVSYSPMGGMASDAGVSIPVFMAATFYWILYLIACGVFLFNWSLY